MTRQRLHALRHCERVMGTVTTFDVYAEEGSIGPELHVCIAKACAMLHRFDAIFSLWKPTSPMSQLRSGKLRLDEAPPVIAEVLELCNQARYLTNGWFDASALPGGLDPTGLVKGWACQRALELVKSSGFTNLIVNAGGDIATCGGPHQSEPWRVGIRDPGSSAHLVAVAEISDAVATSGTYERNSHLFDPKIRRNADRFASASVTGPDLAMADAFATALRDRRARGIRLHRSSRGIRGPGRGIRRDIIQEREISSG